MAAVPVSLGMGVIRKLVASGALQAGNAGIQSAKGFSKELFGYDFVALITKIVIFYTFAYVFAKFMEGVIYGTNFLASFVFGAGKLFGLNLPPKEVFPKLLSDLFIDGYGEYHIKYWDVIKSLSLALVIFEAFQYHNANKNAGAADSPFTLGLFTLIASALAITTFPELVARKGGIGGGGGSNPHLSLGSKTQIQIGDSLNIGADGLVPNVNLILGIVGNTYTEGKVASPEGTLLAFFTPPIGLSPGVYRLYLDQTQYGGPRYETPFTILEGIAA